MVFVGAFCLSLLRSALICRPSVVFFACCVYIDWAEDAATEACGGALVFGEIVSILYLCNCVGAHICFFSLLGLFRFRGVSVSSVSCSRGAMLRV